MLGKSHPGITATRSARARVRHDTDRHKIRSNRLRRQALAMSNGNNRWGLGEISNIHGWIESDGLQDEGDDGLLADSHLDQRYAQALASKARRQPSRLR